MSINKPEPAPAPVEGPACWDRAIDEWHEAFFPLPCEAGTEAHEKICDVHAKILLEFRGRDRLGERKYGVQLRPHDGRDSLVDAIQELADAIVYLTKHQMESGERLPELATLRRLVFTLFQRVEGRASA